MRLNEEALLGTQLEVRAPTYKTFLFIAAMNNRMSLKEAFNHVGRTASASTRAAWKREWIKKGVLKEGMPNDTVSLEDKFVIHDMNPTARTQLRKDIHAKINEIEKQLTKLKNLTEQFE